MVVTDFLAVPGGLSNTQGSPHQAPYLSTNPAGLTVSKKGEAKMTCEK
jgi:hypothetical protein